MSPVTLAELDPITRQRALQQIGETEGTTALAIIEDNNHSSTYKPAEMRARSILSRMESLSAKLKTIEADIRLLWEDFDNLKAGETILGCRTKKEFCEKRLNRTPQAIRYLLNPELRTSKQCLPLTPIDNPVPVTNPDADVEAALKCLQEVDTSNPSVPAALEAAIANPPEAPVAKPPQSTAKVESQSKRVIQEWAAVKHAGIGKLEVRPSNGSSGVTTSLGRYDLHLLGVSKLVLDKIRNLLSEA